MSFNAAKCYILHMTRRHPINQTTYQLHGHKLEEVYATKYLGVTLTTNLKRGAHIQNMANKENKTLCFLKSNLKTSNMIAKPNAYRALVRPIIEYASVVWDPHTTGEIHCLERIQKRAARWITNSPSPDLKQLGLSRSSGS